MRTEISFHIESLKKDINNGNVVIICGAGISNSPPANLPLAKELIKNTVNEFIGHRKKYINDLPLRPEAVFELISRSAKMELAKFLWFTLGNSTPNFNHYSIATILGQGNHIITPNFDCLIEKAADELKVKYRKIVDWGRFPDKKPYIFKVHGTIEYFDSIALTIDNIHSSFKKRKLLTFRQILEGKRVIVLGYSGLDQFDIMPAIKDCSYKDITWINHHCGKLKGALPVKEAKFLKRLNSFNGGTLEFFNKLGYFFDPNFTDDKTIIPSITVHERLKSIIALDILIHLDKYQEIIKIVDDLQLNKYWRFRIAKFEAKSILYPLRNKDWREIKQTFLNSFFKSKYRKTTHGLITMAKWADTPSRVLIAYNEILRFLNIEKNILPGLMEAGCELLFELLERRMFQKAEHLFTVLESLKIVPYSIVQYARFCLEATFYYSIMFEYVSKKKIYLNNGLNYGRTALNLYSEDFINDKYFYLQAQNNLGYIYVLKRNYTLSKNYFIKSEKNFANISKNNQIFSLFLLAKVYTAEGNIYLAKKSILKAFRINREKGRNFYVGFLFRQLFYIQKIIDPKLSNKDIAINFLKKSMEEFLSSKEFEQASYSKELILELDKDFHNNC